MVGLGISVLQLSLSVVNSSAGGLPYKEGACSAPSAGSEINDVSDSKRLSEHLS